MTLRPQNVMSIDVEDWFHILDARGAPSPAAWNTLPSHLERNMNRLLDLFAEHGVRTTQFWLGWAAERFPDLLRRARRERHEIASHGYGHLLVYQAGRRAFADDITRAKRIIEDLCGEEVKGFRAPGFSFTPETPWAYEELCRAGYRYSSSIFPTGRAHGGFRHARLEPHRVETPLGPVQEFPVTALELWRFRVCPFGGGYFRVTPGLLLEAAGSYLNRRGRSVIYYLHPREIDPSQPRMRGLSPLRYFKYYVALASTEAKLRRALATQRFAPFAEHLAAPAGATAGGGSPDQRQL